MLSGNLRERAYIWSLQQKIPASRRQGHSLNAAPPVGPKMAENKTKHYKNFSGPLNKTDKPFQTDK